MNPEIVVNLRLKGCTISIDIIFSPQGCKIQVANRNRLQHTEREYDFVSCDSTTVYSFIHEIDYTKTNKYKIRHNSLSLTNK